MHRICWLPHARDDLRRIRDYIALDSRTNATRWVTKVQAAVENLRLFPEAGVFVPEHNAWRETFVGAYRVMYRIRGKTIHVMAVIHSARLFPGSLFVRDNEFDPM